MMRLMFLALLVTCGLKFDVTPGYVALKCAAGCRTPAAMLSSRGGYALELVLLECEDTLPFESLTCDSTRSASRG